MENRPAFSIISPTYNCEKYILNSWKSLRCQTETDWEWIIVDDGSTDQTLKVLEGIVDERVKVFTYSKNRGRGYARNFALSKASGDILVVWDIDDLYFPDRLAKINKAFENESIEYFCSYAVIVDNEFNVKGMRRFSKDLLFKKSFVHPTLAFRKSVLKVVKYGEDMVAGEDIGLMLYLDKKCKGHYCEEFLMLYLEDREVNLAKTLTFHNSFVYATRNLIKTKVLKLSTADNFKFHIKVFIKTILLNLMRLKPSLYLKTVKYRYLDFLKLEDLPVEKQDFIKLFKNK